MIDTKALRQKILDLAIRGKLVEQDPNDEPASLLIARIKAEKEQLIKEKKIKKEKPLPPIEADEIPFDIPDSWEWVRLGDLGLYKKGPFGSALKKEFFVPKSSESIKVYEQQNAIKKDHRLGSYYITQEKYETLKSNTVYPNDIIVSCAGTIGEIYVLPEDAPIGIINQALMFIRFYEKMITDFFLIYFDFILKNKARKDGKGTAMANIPPFDVLKPYLIPIPSLREQKRIVAKIEELFAQVDAIEKAQNDLVELKKIAKQKVLDLAIRGKLVEQDPNDEPASKLIERIKAEKEQLIKEKKIKKEKPLPPIKADEIPFQIPNGWEWVRLGEMNQPMTSKSPVGDSFTYIDIEAINNKENKIDEPKTVLTTEAPSRAKREVKKGDVLFSLVRPYLKNVAIIELDTDNAIASTGFYVFSSINGLAYQPYIFKYLISAYAVGWINQFMKGDNSPSVRKEDIDKLLVSISPYEEQKRIVAKIEELFEQIDLIR